MDIVGIGIDLVDVERVKRLLERRKTFVERVFAPSEVDYCERQATPAECYAARWAAREACRKALGGVKAMRWQDVRVDRAPTGAPKLSIEGASRRRMETLGVTEVMVALTHERRMAGAFCVALRA
ncbi:MAG: holo-ACP synthase [Actinobacteria bacterium]|jgi:holo-[acyl-carrier protein] synthase|nr:MAG: holo-ACP synthase [Actinomycetota bacterium]